VLKLLALGHCELSLVLTGDPRMRELNHAFRGKDSATDVLSFPQLDMGASPAAQGRPLADCDMMPPMLGDVVISVDTAHRQAEQLGIKTESRLRTLLIHGVLHLLGYDHEKSRADARRMFAHERELATLLASCERTLRQPSAAPPHVEMRELL
jgi:rRNA maturation RNase YbeY